MYCAECFMRDGNPCVDATFVVNGQSVCQRHVHVVIRHPGSVAPAYTWVPDSDYEPVLEPNIPQDSAGGLNAEQYDALMQRLISEAAGLETDAMQRSVSGVPAQAVRDEARAIRRCLAYLQEYSR